MTDEEWQHLYENFETTELLSAVDAVDSLRDDLNDGLLVLPPNCDVEQYCPCRQRRTEPICLSSTTDL